MSKLKVLVTGSSGRIGPHIIPDFNEKYDLRTYDKNDCPGSPDHVSGDLQNVDALRRAMEGREVLVHLAATSDEAPFIDNLVPNNVVGMYNAFQLAQEAGVRRIVFASTCQTVFCYPREQTVNVEDPVRPSTLYGATKAFGEIVGRWYHDKHGMEFVGVRIGWFLPYDSERLKEDHARDIWLSPRDASQFLSLCIEKEGIDYAVVFATSKTRREYLGLRAAREILGYEPQDNVADILK